jgi:hypothetical protein
VREKVLVFGSNFQLAARITEIIKRKYDVCAFRFSSTAELGKHQIATRFDGALLSNLAAYQRADTVVFTTEPLLYLDSEESLRSLIDELKVLKQSRAARLIVVDVDQPVLVREFANAIQVFLPANFSDYSRRLDVLRQSLEGLADLTLAAQSFYSSEVDSWSPNFMVTLLEKTPAKTLDVQGSDLPWHIVSADDIADTILLNINHSGKLTLNSSPYEGGLAAFCSDAAVGFSAWSSEVDAHSRIHDAFPNRKPESGQPLLNVFARQRRCSVNYIYRKSPLENFKGETVAKFRYGLGLALADAIPMAVARSLDFVIPVPETGKLYAQGLSQGIGIPYLEAIYKKDRKRSFDIESFDARKEFLYSRLGAIPDLISGKNIVVVDEAIFTGATLSVVSRLLAASGVGKIYFAIPSLEAKQACKYNMQPERAMLSDYVRRENLRDYFNVDDVFFQEEHVFLNIFDGRGAHCTECFSSREIPR